MMLAADIAPAVDIVGALAAAATTRLGAAGIETARLDAEVLLAQACGLDRTTLYAGWRRAVPGSCRARFDALLTRRLAREPLQYIVGRQEFWSLDFAVSSAVLIPRPETELLIELVLRVLARTSGLLPDARSLAKGPCSLRLCDVGTGSGCIAVALAHELADATVWAFDLSAAALTVAASNVQRHHVAERVHLVHSDLFAAAGDLCFDAIVSNPPYIRSDALGRLQPELAWEPTHALDGGASGLDVIERLVTQSPPRLRPGGWLIMEIGADQGDAVEQLAHAAGFRAVSIAPDYAGHPRALVARKA